MLCPARNQHLFDTSMSERCLFYIHNGHEIPGGERERVACVLYVLFSYFFLSSFNCSTP